jgi:membrane peptidoglycan carboxypeptidase
VFDPGVIADATYAMQQVVQHGTATTVSRLGRPVAGKTGTTDNNKAAWFAGFTPQYATVVAMYRQGKDGSVISLRPWAGAGGQVTGGTLPAQVWTTYMREVLDGVPVADFPQPTYGGEDTGPTQTRTQTQAATPVPTTSTTTRAPSPAPTPTPTGNPTASPTRSPEPTLTSSPSPTRTRPGRPTPRPVPSPTD